MQSIRLAKVIFVIFSTAFFFAPALSKADFVGQEINFNIDQEYDALDRQNISSVLLYQDSKVYFYVEKEWWNALDIEKKQTATADINLLGQEFEQKIYPTLTATFGFEWKPGIDGDEKITILIHSMKDMVGSYFLTGNEYPKVQNPVSNAREMLYVNSKKLGDKLMKSYLAHEFVHLITFNQKEKISGVSDDVWLNEARAEYAPTLLGYDLPFSEGNLRKRLESFIENTFNSLTEWEQRSYDYGSVNLFAQYLVDHYGIQILIDSLRSPKVGIASLDEVLQKNGFSQKFTDIFEDWVVTLYLNDCKFGEKYCYLNPNLKNFRVIPQMNFLPSLGQTTLSLIQTTKDWAGSWYKIIGGKNVLRVEFEGDKKAKFKIMCLIEDSSGSYTLKLLKLDGDQRGTIYVSSFSDQNKALILIPLAETKFSGFENPQSVYIFSYVISTINSSPAEEDERIKELMAKIEYLKQEIAKLQSKIAARRQSNAFSLCSHLNQNLYPGMVENSQVRCLQQFLTKQGKEIYPEGMVTGNFLALTRKAVIRFQEKYAADILKPLGLENGTGFVGSATRTKINELLKNESSSAFF